MKGEAYLAPIMTSLDLSSSNQPSNARTDAQPATAPLWLPIVVGLLAGLSVIPVAGEQISIDAALVLDGVVTYPPLQIMAQFHFGWWTLVNQLAALLLLTGLPQPLIAALPAMTAVGLLAAGYALWLYAFCPRGWFATFAALLLIWIGGTTNFFESPDYGAYAGNGVLHGGIGTTAIYGLCGAAASVLAIGALAANRGRLAGFFAVLTVAIHPVLGVYIVGLSCAIMTVGYLAQYPLPMRDAVSGMAAGLLVVACSFICFLVLKKPTGSVDAETYSAYLKIWDSHRNIGISADTGLRVLVGILVLAGVLGFFLRSTFRVNPSRDCAVAILLASILCSAILYFSVHLVPALVPSLVRRAIPGRLLNLHAYLSGPALVGLIAFGAMLWCDRFKLNTGDSRRLTAAALICVATTMLSLGHTRIRVYGQQYLASWHSFIDRPSPLDDPFWVAVRAQHVRGLVLTSYEAYYPSLRYGHLATAFDPTDFDFVAYLPSIVAEAAKFIQVGFGVSFQNPPQRYRMHGALPPDAGKEYWATLTPQQWAVIARQLQLSALVAPGTWSINLQPLVTGARFSLYLLPVD